MALAKLKTSDLINVAFCEAVGLPGALKLEQALEGTQIIHELNVNKSGAPQVEISGAAKGSMAD